MITSIVCADKNWGIGKKNGLLFSLPADMKYFRKTTMNSIVVCGENTLLSFPNSRPLNHRTTIVLCSEDHEYPDCICVHNFDYLVNMLKCLNTINSNIFIIGGGMMYKSMMPYCERVLVNRVDAEDSEATVFFPNMDENTDFELLYTDPPVNDNGFKTQIYHYVSKKSLLDC